MLDNILQIIIIIYYFVKSIISLIGSLKPLSSLAILVNTSRLLQHRGVK